MQKPIRVNVQDPAHEIAVGLALGVRVNGQLVPFCFLADEAEGFAECLMHDRHVRSFLPPDQDGELRTCRYIGRVEIVARTDRDRELLEQCFAVGG